ncbi:MAG TPA: MFS transporter [Nitrospirales bacterium]|nr:MFS transporter [Nitrospirales bacterium]
MPEATIAPADGAAPDRRVPDETGWRLLLTRDFGSLWLGQAVSQIGDGLNRVALLWFVYELTGSAFKMTLIGLLQTIPPLVFGPLIGVYLDRLPKKPVMIWVDVIRAGLILLIPLLHAAGELSLERLYALVFIISLVSTIFGPALTSAVPLIVSRSQLTAGNALIQTTANIGLLAGPAISGFGIALVGAQNVLYINVVTFLVSAIALLPVRIRREEITGPVERATLLHDMLVGFRFIFKQHGPILALMITAALYSLASAAFTFLLPVYAKDMLGVGPVQLGGLWSALGVGMLIASAWLAWIRQGDLRNRLRIISGSMAVGGLAVCGLGMLSAPLLATGLIMIVGGSTALFMPVAWAVVQEMTPGHLMARVLTTFSTGGMFAAMVGMTGFGWAADTLGPATTLLGIGAVLIGTALIAAHFSQRCQPAMSPL